jgi:hypothetical protein
MMLSHISDRWLALMVSLLLVGTRFPPTSDQASTNTTTKRCPREACGGAWAHDGRTSPTPLVGNAPGGICQRPQQPLG